MLLALFLAVLFTIIVSSNRILLLKEVSGGTQVLFIPCVTVTNGVISE